MAAKKVNSNGSGNGTATADLVSSEPKVSRKNKITTPAKEVADSEIPETTDAIDPKELLQVLMEVKNGNFAVRMPIDQVGVSGKIYDTLNEIISLNEKMMAEFTKAGNTIGKQGKLTQRIEVPDAKGAWSTGVESLNSLISDFVHPTIEIAHVISSVAKGN